MKNTITIGKYEFKIPHLLLMVGALLLLLTLILPYSTAIGDFKDSLKEDPDIEISDEIDMTTGDMVNLSMVEYAKAYGSIGGSWEGYVVLIVIYGIFAFLAFLLSLKKKPIGTLIFTILTFIIFSIQKWDFSDRKVVPSDSYAFGIGFYVYYIAAIAIFIGAVWTVIIKIQDKKKQKETPPSI